MQPSWTSGRAFRKATADSWTRTARPAVLSRKASDCAHGVVVVDHMDDGSAGMVRLLLLDGCAR